MWITFLFFTPLVLQAVGLWRLREDATFAFWLLNYGATLFCQSVYCWLWVAYSDPSLTGQAWSYLALASTIVVLGFVIAMTFAVMRATPRKGRDGAQAAAQAGQQATQSQPAATQQRTQGTPLSPREVFFEKLSDGVGAHPFWAITFFMSLFLGVSYLFGFALAFHDRHTLAEEKDKPALYMVKHESVDDKYLPTQTPTTGTPPGGGQTDSNPSQTTGAGALPVAGSQEEFRFHFEDAKANVHQSKYGCNSCSLEKLLAKLTEKIEQEQRVKVTLLGHTDNEPILVKVGESTSTRYLSSYLSNYELSLARAQNVQYEVLQRLRDKLRDLQNVQWAVYPTADEPLVQVNHGAMHLVATGAQLERYRQDEKGYREEIDRKLPKEEKRVVVAMVEPIQERPIVIGPEQLRGITSALGEQYVGLAQIKTWQEKYAVDSKPKQLRLMDYVYFSIYTITTTGYGDIVPNTAYAKFITSVANIFEVIFLVVFFNAILSLKGSRGDGTTPVPNVAGSPVKDEKSDNTGPGGSPPRLVSSQQQKAG
jgi:flagellar motor protein MotB